MPKLFAVYVPKGASANQIQVTELAIIETCDNFQDKVSEQQLKDRGHDVVSVVPVPDEDDLCELIRLVYQAGMEHNNEILYGRPQDRTDFGRANLAVRIPQSAPPLWSGEAED